MPSFISHQCPFKCCQSLPFPSMPCFISHQCLSLPFQMLPLLYLPINALFLIHINASAFPFPSNRPFTYWRQCIVMCIKMSFQCPISCPRQCFSHSFPLISISDIPFNALFRIPSMLKSSPSLQIAPSLNGVSVLWCITPLQCPFSASR